jgi:hypothetical protein
LLLLATDRVESGLSAGLHVGPTLALIVIQFTALDANKQRIDVVKTVTNVTTDVTGDDANGFSLVLLIGHGADDIGELTQDGDQGQNGSGEWSASLASERGRRRRKRLRNGSSNHPALSSEKTEIVRSSPASMHRGRARLREEDGNFCTV